MKKMLSIILCICMLSSLSACTTNDTTTNEDTTKETLKSLSSFSEPNKNETFDYTGYTTRKLYDWGNGLVVPMEKPDNCEANLKQYSNGYIFGYELVFQNTDGLEKYYNKMQDNGWNCSISKDGMKHIIWRDNMEVITTRGGDWTDDRIVDVWFNIGKDTDWNDEELTGIEKQVSDLGYNYNRKNTSIIELDTKKITDNENIHIYAFKRNGLDEDTGFITYACIVENGKVVLFSPYIFDTAIPSECRMVDLDSDGIDEFISSSELLDYHMSSKSYSTIRILKKDNSGNFKLVYNYRLRYAYPEQNEDYLKVYLIGDEEDNKVPLVLYTQDWNVQASYYYDINMKKWTSIQGTKTDMYLTYKDGKYIIENQKDIEIIEASDKMIEY